MSKQPQSTVTMASYKQGALLSMMIAWLFLAIDVPREVAGRTLDVVPDAVGYLLMALAAFSMRGLKRVLFGGVFAVVALVVELVLFATLPQNAVLGLTIALMLSNMLFVLLFCLALGELVLLTGEVKRAKRYRWYGILFAITNLTMFVSSVVLPGLFILAGWILLVVSMLIMWMFFSCIDYLKTNS